MRSCAHEVPTAYILRVKNDQVHNVEKNLRLRKWQSWSGKSDKNKIISNRRALLQTREKTCAKFQKDRFKIVWEVAMVPSVYNLRSVNGKVQKEQKSDKKYGKDYMKSTCTSSDYGENVQNSKKISIKLYGVQLLLQFCTNYYETLHVFSSWCEDVHVIWM